MLKPRTLLVIILSLGLGFIGGYLSRRAGLSLSGLLTTVREPAAGSTDRLDEQLLELSTLGYLAGYEPPTNLSGVVTYTEESASPGWNLYTSGHGPEAALMDLDGNVLHTWYYDVRAMWSDGSSTVDDLGYLRRAHLFPNGDLLVIYDPRNKDEVEKHVLLKLDKDSNLLWAYRGGAHHDLQVLADGRIYVLTRQFSQHGDLHQGRPVLEDFITVLSPDGEPIEHVSILQALRNSEYVGLFARIPDIKDVMHTNTLEVLPEGFESRVPAFEEGSVLISMLHLNTIAVVNIERTEVTWAMQGMWNEMHQPTLLDSGHILIFDNRGQGGFSRVIEFDPSTQRVVWLYTGEGADQLSSFNSGSNQRLPNGNTLVTESTRGRVIELSPEQEIVWEFINPNRVVGDEELVAVIPELVRLDLGDDRTWIEGR